MPEVMDAPQSPPARKPFCAPQHPPEVRAAAQSAIQSGMSSYSTAKLLNLPEATVRKWVRTKGWANGTCTKSHASNQGNQQLVVGTVTRVNTKGHVTRDKLAKAVDKLTDDVLSDEVTPEGAKGIKTLASAVKSLTDSAKVIHGWSEADNSTYAFAAVMGEVVRSADGPERPAIEVESKPSQGS